ncbi:asparagine synthase (glutamine-hydrolyzing) [Motiliproteus coralliicola]|uniref:asparagine synthase (glutamine-hydrolyzing) n=1 Tax=Motiliproteus coralliicola TaxID=2283196 RepID=A0A369WR01_9GAMM|nr:asparagine synthase (glutamine-hydrolyzing) [Motiliproteus coralliicola]RDE22986.1 asparagine synthase (glutamine-hydrolyzing) [Motiliproteus coralliicola]
MCGLVGQWRLDGEAVNFDALIHAREAMVNRGPDDAGVEQCLNGSMAMAHRRLSIIDLSQSGHQPMKDLANGNLLVFNGEIYNHQELREELVCSGCVFSSSSDTEVILHAYRHWGRSCFSRFIGMFALALFDQHKQELLLARDRFGVKPLFYSRDSQQLSFASRLKPLQLLRGHCQLDSQALGQFYEMGWVCGSDTLIEGVRKVAPGSCLTFRADGHCHVENFWRMPTRLAKATPWTDSSVDELDRLLNDSVRLRLTSDVPVGVFLSGGIDSSLVAALMAEQSSEPVTAFTLGFDHPDYDESRYAKQIARHLGCRYEELVLSPSGLLAEAERVFPLSDEPLTDPAMLPTSIIARLASEQQVKVCLTGDGGDELFLGYRLHQVMERFRRLEQIGPLAARAMAVLARFLPAKRYALIRGFLQQPNFESRYCYLRAMVSGPLGESWQALAQEPFSRTLNSSFGATRAAELDIRSYLPEQLLSKTDLSTMQWSVEAREPLLDHRLAEFSARFAVPDLMGKSPLKHVLQRYLPNELWDRPKQGFNVPVDDWLRGPMFPLLDQLRDEWEDDEWLSRGKICELVDDFLIKGSTKGNFIWALAAFVSWKNNLQQWSSKQAFG